MLTATRVRRRGNRSQAILAAAIPTARSASLGSAAATAALGITPLVITVVRGGTDLGAAAVAAGLVGGAALAWAADDSMAEVLTAAPIGNAVRLLTRIAFIAAATAVMWSIAAVVAANGPGMPPDLSLRAAETATATTMALVFGVATARRGERHPGVGGVIGGLLAVLTVAALAQRWVWLPTLASGPAHDRWWLVAALGLIVLVRVARDPGRR